VSARVADASAHGVVWSRLSSTPRLPASTMKLVTATTAMTTMGTARRLPTRIVSGSGSRDLVLVAGGDPLLTSGDLSRLAATTAARLVATLPAAPLTPPTSRTSVGFTVHIDDSLFAPATSAPGWVRGYVPSVVRPVRALVRDRRSNSDTSADTGRYLTVELRRRVAAALGASRPDLAVNIWWHGRERAPRSAPVLAAYAGHTVGSALAAMLLVSDNDIAEMMYRLSAVASGRAGSWRGGEATARATMAKLGVPLSGLALRDGSGVSRSDRLTASALVTLLRAAQSPRNRQLAGLRAMLPVAGVSGTLKASNGRFTTAPSRCARGIVRAKTGTLHDVVALAGYTTGRDGRLKVFAILVNSRPERRYSPLATRRAVDALAATVTGCY
jgi:D-alanyl-D-alanine carboxypeptidase/D-alanyl-D-alanine-endopeptidase (penicillin-binding protein 4)